MADMGKWYGYYRERMGLTQTQVAEQLGIAVQSYQKYETGERNPKKDRKNELADIFQVNFHEMSQSPAERYRDMLFYFARSSVLGHLEDSRYFWSDREYDDKIVFPVMMDTFDKWKRNIAKHYPKLFGQFVVEPRFDTLALLAKHMRYFEMKENLSSESEYLFSDYPAPPQNITSRMHILNGNQLDAMQMFQAVFSIVFMLYVQNNNLDSILHQVKDHIQEDWLDEKLGDTYESVALRYFGTAVFTPFAHLLGEVLGQIDIAGRTLDDFEKIFFYKGDTVAESLSAGS